MVSIGIQLTSNNSDYLAVRRKFVKLMDKVEKRHNQSALKRRMKARELVESEVRRIAIAGFTNPRHIQETMQGAEITTQAPCQSVNSLNL